MHMMMRRPAAMYAVLPLLVALAVCVSFLFQVSDCSRPSPEEPRTIPRPVPVVLRDDDDEPHVQRQHRDNADGIGSTTRPAGLEMEAGAVGKKAARADDDGGAAPSATTAPGRDMVGHQVGSGSSDLGGALMMMATTTTTTTTMRPPVRLRSELPRRVLAGAPPVVEGAADSAAKSSCHSSDVHISCPPSRN